MFNKKSIFRQLKFLIMKQLFGFRNTGNLSFPEINMRYKVVKPSDPPVPPDPPEPKFKRD